MTNKKVITIFLLLSSIIFSVSSVDAQDGVYVFQPSESDSYDTIIGQKNPNTNFGTWINVNFGEQDNDLDLGRSLIKFSIPTNVNVISASICLYSLSENSSNTTIAEVFRMKKSWNESSATWYSSGFGQWQNPGAFGFNDSEQYPIGILTLSPNESAGEKCFYLSVPEIQQMVSGTFINNGFLFKTRSETNDLYRFCSSSCPIASQRPKIFIEYSPISSPTQTPTVTSTQVPIPSLTPTAYTPQSLSINPDPSSTLIIPIMGQSNASGRGAIISQTTNTKVLLFGNDYLYHLLTEPSDTSLNQVDIVSIDDNAGYGFATELGKRIQALYPTKTIVIVQCAKGSSSLNSWQRSYADDTLYGSCLKRIRASLGEVLFIAFSQGETDAMTLDEASTWAYRFGFFVSSIREDVGSVPIVYTQLGKYNNSSTFPYWDLVKNQQSTISIPCVEMIQTDDLPMSFPHYTSQGYDTIAKRMSEEVCLIESN